MRRSVSAGWLLATPKAALALATSPMHIPAHFVHGANIGDPGNALDSLHQRTQRVKTRELLRVHAEMREYFAASVSEADKFMFKHRQDAVKAWEGAAGQVARTKVEFAGKPTAEALDLSGASIVVLAVLVGACLAGLMHVWWRSVLPGQGAATTTSDPATHPTKGAAGAQCMDLSSHTSAVVLRMKIVRRWLLAACNWHYYWPEAARRPTRAAAGSVLAARDTTMHSQHDSGEASEQLARLRQMMECDICFERYSSEKSRTARNLACGHSFCCGCLASLLAPLAGSGDHKLLPCPACRAVTKVPMGRPENLSCNWAVTA
jgi:hypothetical protein